MNRFSTSLLGEAKTLLLATDGSHFSDGALQEAIFFVSLSLQVGPTMIPLTR